MSNDLAKIDQYTSELDYARTIGKMIVKSGRWAKDWNEDTVAIIVLYARDLGIHPVTALVDGFDIIQGKISMKPKMMASMIRKAGHSIVFKRNDSEMCHLIGRRKDNGDVCEVKFSIEDAKKAGLAGKDNWKNWSADMLYSRAMGRLGRMLFSDVIGGVYSDGEMEDIKSKTSVELVEADAQVVSNQDGNGMVALESLPEPVESLTIDDLVLGLGSIAIEAEKVKLGEFVKYMAVKHGRNESTVIKSALLNAEQLEKFGAAFVASDEKKV